MRGWHTLVQINIKFQISLNSFSNLNLFMKNIKELKKQQVFVRVLVIFVPFKA